jgi:cytochrome c-type biogenesis protein CcmE
VRWWKVLGVAAFAGVAAGGVLVARDERRRLAYTPGEIRQRLHERVEEASAPAVPPDDAQRPPGSA